MPRAKEDRYWELDFLRGGAIICMVIFHLIYQLYYVFGAININVNFFTNVPKLAAIFFILLGISLYIAKERGAYPSFKYIFKRFLLIFGFGTGITLATLIANTGFYIYFGVLHCHGLSTLISYFVTKWNKWIVLIAAVTLIIVQFYIPYGNCEYLYFLYPNRLPACAGGVFDYFPLIPNLGYAFLGVFIGQHFYTNGRRQFKSKLLDKYGNYFRPICYAGEKTLWIYVIHIPILFILNDIFLYFFKPSCFINILDYIR